MRKRFIATSLVLVAACGFPKPEDVASDVPGDTGGSGSSGDDSGSSASPDSILHVSPSGDDANDGVTAPVQTLKHAIGLAAANTQIVQISVAAGTYSASSGELFPYTVPPNVTIVGPAGGGATLRGTRIELGLLVGTGALQDLDLQDFTTAITITGIATLKDIRILTSAIAVQEETGGRLEASHLELAGSTGACAHGLILIGAAELDVDTLSSVNLADTLKANGQAAISIRNARISGDSGCTMESALINVTTNAPFVLADSLLDGGGHHGMLIDSGSLLQQLLKVDISNTTIRNMKGDGLDGGHFGAVITANIKSSILSNNIGGGVEFAGGTWLLTGVSIQQNSFALYEQYAALNMRNNMIVDNGSGLDIYDGATADLGTVADPGGNTIQRNANVGLSLNGTQSGGAITAVGNVWNPNKQGSDSNGQYLTHSTISRDVTGGNGDNYTVLNGLGWSLSL